MITFFFTDPLKVIEEKWFNTPNDYQIWLKGFSKEQFQLFVAIEKGTGNFIGSVTLTTHELVNGEKISCVGTFILHPEFRGQGIGLTLFNEALKHGATNKTLVAVPSMSDKYASKFGFNVIGTKIIDYYAKCSALKLSSLLTDSRLKITDPSEVGWEKIYAYDRSITGMCFRGDFLREFFSQPGAYNKVVLNENNDIVGYCNIRTGPDNILSIGPFYANSVQAAESVLYGVLELVPGLATLNLIRMATSSENKDAQKLFHTLTNGDYTTSNHYTQFTQKVLQIPFQNVYSITENDLNFV